MSESDLAMNERHYQYGRERKSKRVFLDSRHADLARVRETAKQDSIGGSFEIRVRHNDDWRFATKLQASGLQMFPTDLCNFCADDGRSCEVDFADGGMGDDGFADGRGVLLGDVDDIENASGQACVDKELGGERMDLGAMLRGLEDARVAGHDSVGECADGKDERGVPGCLSVLVFMSAVRSAVNGVEWRADVRAMPKTTPYGTRST